jgi:hypothetical protein
MMFKIIIDRQGIDQVVDTDFIAALISTEVIFLSRAKFPVIVLMSLIFSGPTA